MAPSTGGNREIPACVFFAFLKLHKLLSPCGGVTNLSCGQMIATQLSSLKMIMLENKFSPIIFNPDNLRLHQPCSIRSNLLRALVVVDMHSLFICRFCGSEYRRQS